MAGKYDRDELFIALKRYNKTEREAVDILDELDRKGTCYFTMGLITADELQRQFHSRHRKYQASLSHGEHAGGWIVVHVNSLCVKREAPWVNCRICGTPVKTCERKEPVENDYRCPVHPDGAQLRDGSWVCSGGCHEIATGPHS